MKNFKRTVLCTVIALSLFGCDEDDNIASAGINAAAVSETSIKAAQTAPKNIAVEAAVEVTTAAVEEREAAVKEADKEDVTVQAEAPAVVAEETTLPVQPAETVTAETPVAEEQPVENVAEVKQEAAVEPEVKAEPEVVAEAEVKQETPAKVEETTPVEPAAEEVIATPVVEAAEVSDTAPVVEVSADDNQPAPADEVPAAEPAVESTSEVAVEPTEPVAEPAPAPQVEEPKSELIEKVKAYIYDDVDPTLKVGSALKTRRVCEGVEWAERVDHRERDTAVYSCTHRGYEDYFDNLESNRLGQYVQKAEAGIPALKEKAEKALDAFNSYSWYLSFIERLQEKGLIDGLIKIKNEESSDYRYLSYLISPNKEQYLTDRTPEIKETYIGVFNILDSMLGSNEVGETVDMSEVHMDERERLYDDIVNNGFKEFIDAIAEKGNAEEAIEFANGKAKVLSDELNEASGQLETLEYQLTNEGMESRVAAWTVDRPVNVVSSISFAMGKDRPYVVGCTVSFYTSESPEKPVFIKSINNANTCLTENYKEDYDAFYHNAFEQFYQSRMN